MVETGIGSARFNGCLSGVTLANAGPAHQRGQPIASLAPLFQPFARPRSSFLSVFFFERMRKKCHGLRVSQFFRQCAERSVESLVMLDLLRRITYTASEVVESPRQPANTFHSNQLARHATSATGRLARLVGIKTPSTN
jgi:hypothetical protein